MCSKHDAGREIEPEQTLESAGLTDGSEVVVVRKQLVAEGWKMVNDSLEDSDTEEDDF